MQLVEPTVETRLDVFVSSALSVVAKAPCSLRESGVCRQHHTAIAHRAQVLRRIKARTGSQARGTRRSSISLGAGRLRAVLHDKNVVFGGQAFETGWINGMSVQVDGHHSANRGIGSDRCVELIEVQAARLVDIAPHGLGAGTDDGERRGECRQWGCNDTGASGYVGASQCYLECVEPTCHPDCIWDSPPSGQLPLKCEHLLTEYQPATSAYTVDRRDCILVDGAPLPREVIGWDLE